MMIWSSTNIGIGRSHCGGPWFTLWKLPIFITVLQQQLAQWELVYRYNHEALEVENNEIFCACIDFIDK